MRQTEVAQRAYDDGRTKPRKLLSFAKNEHRFSRAPEAAASRQQGYATCSKVLQSYKYMYLKEFAP